MKTERTLIAVIATAHFGLCLFLVRLFQFHSTAFLARLYMCLVFPLNLLPNTSWLWPWYSFYWPPLILLVALDSIIWGVALGVPIYAIWRRHRKSVA